MVRGRWLLVGLVSFVVLIGIVGATVSMSIPTPSVAAGAGATSTPGATLTPTPVPSPTASPSPPATPTPTPDPTADPTPTDPPTASGDPRLLYAEFLLRVDDDRSRVTTLNQTLADAAQVPNLKKVKAAAVDILDFVDAERDWLSAHPPAACYADAHRDARRMLAAYGTAADGFITWAGTGGGLAGAGALLDALAAADKAGAALTTFGKTLEATRCPA